MLRSSIAIRRPGGLSFAWIVGDKSWDYIMFSESRWMTAMLLLLHLILWDVLELCLLAWDAMAIEDLRCVRALPIVEVWLMQAIGGSVLWHIR